mmetsp:Transcript_78238/g.253402  ORF Transcript_78238/g.253402 Transcript_78238/m.253402 type:complete len:229 (+) Transcript_78238:233-919(+)
MMHAGARACPVHNDHLHTAAAPRGQGGCIPSISHAKRANVGLACSGKQRKELKSASRRPGTSSSLRKQKRSRCSCSAMASCTWWLDMSPSFGTTTRRRPARRQSRMVPAPACEMTSAARRSSDGKSGVYSRTSTSSSLYAHRPSLPRFTGRYCPDPRCTFSFRMPMDHRTARNSTLSTALISESNFVEPTVTTAVWAPSPVTIGGSGGRSAGARGARPTLHPRTSSGL